MLKRLILKFDINGTITNYSKGRKFRDNPFYIISSLAKGTVDNDGNWKSSGYHYDTNTIDDEISYFDYLKDRFNPDEIEKRVLRCTQKDEPCDDYFKISRKLFDIIHNEVLFPSFLNVLQVYPEAKVVIRSYGGDIGKVAEVLTNNNYSYIKGKLCHTFDSESKDSTPDTIIYIDDKELTKEEFGQFILDCDKRVIIIRDDWKAWKNNKYGKVLFHIPETLQLFFDNTKCVKYDENSKDCHFFHINSIDAAVDKFYFQRLIKDFDFQ